MSNYTTAEFRGNWATFPSLHFARKHGQLPSDTAPFVCKDFDTDKIKAGKIAACFRTFSPTGKPEGCYYAFRIKSLKPNPA